MALTSQQEDKLRTIPQRADVRFGVFPQFHIETSAPAGGQMSFKAMVRISPRYSMVWAGDSIDLYGGDSYKRGGSAVSTYAWTVEEGSGITLDNAATATVTVNTTTATTAKIKLTVDAGLSTEQYSYAYVKVYASGTRGYDGKVQITSFRASSEQGGTEMELLCHDGAAAITANAGILIWVQDYWNEVEDTFGGYKYPEGVFFGYVVGETIKEDHKEQALRFQVASPTAILKNTEIQYTSFYLEGEPDLPQGVYYHPGAGPDTLRPVDCLWIILQDLTNFPLYHGVVLWYDENEIRNLQIDRSDLWTIIVDVMERTFGIAFCDRYGELKCVPHQVVRADEWWGTPSPIMEFDNEMILEIEVEGLQEQPIQKVTLQALSSALPADIDDFEEIIATAETVSDSGRGLYVKGLICNSTTTLQSWADDVLDWKENKYWKVRLTTPLNHVLDIHEPCDIDYTPVRSGTPLATHHWGVESLEFRIDVGTGRWTTRYELYQTAAKV